METFKKEWVEEQENLLKNWAEKSRYYSWMHHKTSTYYSRVHNTLSFPLIIISTICGSANFMMVGNKQSSLFYTTICPLSIGILSMFTAILSALSKYMKAAELSEEHIQCYKQYNKLSRNICMELSIPNTQRKASFEMCNEFRYNFDRLMSDSPQIPEHIIFDFNKKFPYVKNKPEISSNFEKIIIYGRNKKLKEKENTFRTKKFFNQWRNFENNNYKTQRAISIDL
jgi:hypothetical protein